MKEIIDLKVLRNSIQHIEVKDEAGVRDVLVNAKLLSLTEPLLFDALEHLFRELRRKNISGDILEAGVWSGATAMYMKGLLTNLEMDCTLWLMDLFGTPMNFDVFKHEKDLAFLNRFLTWEGVKIPKFKEVIANFENFNLLDEKTKFIIGDVCNTFTEIETESIALLRIDLDFYETTYFMMDKFYSRVPIGGYILIDDYGVKELNCNEAVDDFRRKNNITSKLQRVGDYAVYWEKE